MEIIFTNTCTGIAIKKRNKWKWSTATIQKKNSVEMTKFECVFLDNIPSDYELVDYIESCMDEKLTPIFSLSCF